MLNSICIISFIYLLNSYHFILLLNRVIYVFAFLRASHALSLTPTDPLPSSCSTPYARWCKLPLGQRPSCLSTLFYGSAVPLYCATAPIQC